MKITAYVDQNGDMAGLYTGGVLQLYTKEGDCWTLNKQVPLNITSEMNISEVKTTLRTAVAHLEDCKTLLSAEVRGLLYSILQEEMGFRTWKSEGSLQEQLDNVARNELDLALKEALAAAEAKQAAEAAVSSGCGGGSCGGKGRQVAEGQGNAESTEEIPQPECTREGYYQLNLEQVLKDHKSLNSRQVLLPFLEGTVFQQFDILCDHVPRWLSHKLEELNLMAEFEDLNGPKKGLKVRVTPKSESTLTN